MLCQFSFQNFKSYKDETTFDFRAMAIPEFQDALIRQEKAEDLLPVSAVYGPNGGGKTTLIKIILGLLKPASGSVRFYKNEKEVPEIAMGYLPQYNSIDKKFPISVYEVVLSGLNQQKSLFHR